MAGADTVPKEQEERLFDDSDVDIPDAEPEQPTNDQPAGKPSPNPTSSVRPARKANNSGKPKPRVLGINRPGKVDKCTAPPSGRLPLPTDDECLAKLLRQHDDNNWRAQHLQREVSTALDNNHTLRQHSNNLFKALEERDKFIVRLQQKVENSSRVIDQLQAELTACKQREAYQAGQLHESRKLAAVHGSVLPNLVPISTLQTTGSGGRSKTHRGKRSAQAQARRNTIIAAKQQSKAQAKQPITATNTNP